MGRWEPVRWQGERDKMMRKMIDVSRSIFNRRLSSIWRIGGFIPAGVFALLLWVVASLPGDGLQRVQSVPSSQLLAIILSDPFMHFLTSGLLALLVCTASRAPTRRSLSLAKIALATGGYGLLIELYQGLLPWRAFGLDDLFWNAVGVLFVLVLFRWPWPRSGWGHGKAGKDTQQEQKLRDLGTTKT